MSPRDTTTLLNPTRSKQEDEDVEAPVEVEAWPDEAHIASLMRNGFTYSEAYHMSPRDYRRYSGLFAAWAVPPDERRGGTRAATQKDIEAEFGDC